MKKQTKYPRVAAILALALIFALSACGNPGANVAPNPVATPSAAAGLHTDLPNHSPGEPGDGGNPGGVHGGTEGLAGEWVSAGETRGASLKVEETSVVSFTYFDEQTHTTYSYEGLADIDAERIVISEKNSGEMITCTYSITDGMLSLGVDGKSFTLQRR